MINLSDRLQKIADNISKGETMADIGTDHGFLPIYLIQKELSPHVIMADISGPSLDKARRNAALYLGPETEAAEFRVGNGLKVLKPAEVDDIVIAGMGGKLMIDIMEADLEHTRSFKKFILQPRIGQGHLRKWLMENGFVIVGDDLVYEGRFIPEIITAVTAGNGCDGGAAGAGNDNSGNDGDSGGRSDSCIEKEAPEDITYGMLTEYDMAGKTGDDMLYRIPPWIVRADGPVEEFLLRNIEGQKKKIESVMLAKQRNRQLEEKICDGIHYLKKLLGEYRNGH